MAIGILTGNGDLGNALVSNTDTIRMTVGMKFPKLDGLFLDWVDTQNKKKSIKDFAFQGALATHYSKKNIPIVIYDRYMCINDKEYKWLHKFNTYMFEPALNNRDGFGYIPYTINTNHNVFEDKKRSVDIGYCGDRNISSFEKYYIDYMSKYHYRNVQYKGEVDWRNIRYTVAIGSKRDYDIGYLNPYVAQALNNNCMVLCPMEHKYYIGLFYGYNVETIDYIDYYVGSEREEIRQSMLLSLYERINKDYKEFTIEYTTKKIMECYK